MQLDERKNARSNRTAKYGRRKDAVKIICFIAIIAFLIATLAINIFLVKKVNGLCDKAETVLKISRLESEKSANDNPIESAEKTATKSNTSVLGAYERDLIERVVAAEARGEEYKGKIAVAQTIKDRGDLWGMSYEEVVLSPGQYAAPYKGEKSDEVKNAVSEVFDYGARAFEEPTTHFHAEGVNPSWASEKVSRGQIGRHKFYY